MLFFYLTCVIFKENVIFSLAQRYCDEVANPLEMILFRKVKSGEKLKHGNDVNEDLDDIAELFQGDVKKILSFLERQYIDFVFYLNVIFFLI